MAHQLLASAGQATFGASVPTGTILWEYAMMFRALLAAGAIVTMLPAAASAATVTINNITATWSGATTNNGGGVSYSGNGSSDPTVWWGVPVGSDGQSGYKFDGVTPPAVEIDVTLRIRRPMISSSAPSHTITNRSPSRG